MRRLFQPTLLRRVVVSLLIAFVLVWLVLSVFEFIQIRASEANNPGLRNSAEQLIDVVSTTDDPAEVRTLIGGLDRSGDRQRLQAGIPGSLLIQVIDLRAHVPVYSSPRLMGATLEGIANAQTTQVLHGESLHLFEVDSPRWSVRVAQTRLDTVWVLRQVGLDLIEYLLIALPLVMVPVWIAVAQGLRPLQRLSEQIAARQAEEIAPIGVETKYAELKPLVRELDRLLERQARRIEREHAFVQEAAHELRTPLAVLSAQAHVLEKAPDEPSRQEAAKQLARAVERTAHLTHQLLALARMEAEAAPGPGTLDIAELTRAELAQFAAALADHRMELELEAPDRLMMRLDTHAFASIVQNLVDNAIRYGSEGGRISVELRAHATTLSLSVSDDGPGIATEARPRVFDRFYRGTDHEAAGTGLGLSIVSAAAARLGGRVELSTAIDGHGCRFSVEFPTSSMQSPSS